MYDLLMKNNQIVISYVLAAGVYWFVYFIHVLVYLLYWFIINYLILYRFIYSFIYLVIYLVLVYFFIYHCIGSFALYCTVFQRSSKIHWDPVRSPVILSRSCMYSIFFKSCNDPYISISCLTSQDPWSFRVHYYFVQLASYSSPACLHISQPADQSIHPSSD